MNLFVRFSLLKEKLNNENKELELVTEDFPRIRIGIGNPEYKNDLLNYILTRIPDDEYTILEILDGNVR